MPKTVLIVEDDDHIRSIYGAALSERGYHVVTATQGAEGVHLARRRRPDLILLDIRMPVMDGWGAAHYLRSDPETRGIPLYAISAHELDPEEREAGRIHFDGFLAKPIDPRDMVAEVERRIGPPGQELSFLDVPSPE